MYLLHTSITGQQYYGLMQVYADVTYTYFVYDAIPSPTIGSSSLAAVGNFAATLCKFMKVQSC